MKIFLIYNGYSPYQQHESVWNGCLSCFVSGIISKTGHVTKTSIWIFLLSSSTNNEIQPFQTELCWWHWYEQLFIKRLEIHFETATPFWKSYFSQLEVTWLPEVNMTKFNILRDLKYHLKIKTQFHRLKIKRFITENMFLQTQKKTCLNMLESKK